MTESFFPEYLVDGELDDAGRRVGDLIWGMFTTPVTMAIADLNIAGVLGDAELTASQIADAIGADPEATARLLWAGAGIGLIRSGGGSGDDRRYALTDMGRWLRPDVSGLALMSGIWQAAAAIALAGISDHVRKGGKADPEDLAGYWNYVAVKPGQPKRFADAMGFVTSRVLKGMTVSGYRPPQGTRRVVDVGGGRGTVLAWMLQAMPEASGVLLDRPEALAVARDYLAGQGVENRVDPVEGSFLDEVPEGDLHVLCNVLHDWDDDKVRLIAENCARASRPGGWLIVVDFAVPEVPSPSLGPVMDVAMMVMLGGRERALEETRALIEPAGYAWSRETPVPVADGHPPMSRILEFQRT